jgi:uncharacterized repeat protein (TIGR02543 family)
MDGRKSGYSVRCIKAATYTLSLQDNPEGGGGVTGSGVYSEGTTVNIIATANEGYRFVNWTGDTHFIANPSEASTTATIPTYDISLTANFEVENQVIEVINPATGMIWMDRNLGASRAATSSTDPQAYGDLYQWGRSTDGHEKRNSGTTSTLSNSDTPGHGHFILPFGIPWDWRSPPKRQFMAGNKWCKQPLVLPASVCPL